MKISRKLASVFAGVLFSVGLLVGLALSGWYVWGEAEAALFVPRTGDITLTTLKCPLMLGVSETGTVSASFQNLTSDAINPTIQAEFGRNGIPREEDTVLSLAPGETKQLHWQVGAGDRIFGGLIQVNIYQTSQVDFPSAQGSCGILFIPAGHISGRALFLLMFITALVGLAAGLALWVRANSPLRDLMQSGTNAASVLAVVVGLSLLFILLRWWVLSGFFVLAAIMLIGIILTQFVLFPGAPTRARP